MDNSQVDEAPARPPLSRIVRTAGPPLVVVALIVGAFVAFQSGDSSDEPAQRGPSRNATPIPAASGPNDAVMAVDGDRPQRPAATAAGAVDAYIKAEIAGDFAGSWALLSAEDRDDIGTFNAWNDQHSVAPRLIFSSVVATAPGEPVVTEATFEPRIDETVGVIAGGARITWAVVSENGGFTIDRSGTKADAHYPGDSLAPGDAQEWLEGVRRDEPPTGYRGTLLGEPDLVAALRDADGRFRPTTTIELDDWATPELVTNAFGPGASTWARVVHFDGPIGFDAVLAPYGDRWVVVGVVPT